MQKMSRMQQIILFTFSDCAGFAGPSGVVSDNSTKIIDNKEQYNHPPQAAPSFAAVLKTIEIMQLFKIAEIKLAISRISIELIFLPITHNKESENLITAISET